MFQNLRPGNPIYILYKGNDPHCDIGSVVSATKPEPRFKTAVPTYPQDMVVNVTFKTGEKTDTLQGLPANLIIADNQDVVVSCDKAAINAEIEAMREKSTEILGSIEYHQRVVDSCEKMLEAVNPEFAEKQAQQQEIVALKERIASMDSKFDSLYSLLEKTLNGETKKSTKTS